MMANSVRRQIEKAVQALIAAVETDYRDTDKNITCEVTHGTISKVQQLPGCLVFPMLVRKRVSDAAADPIVQCTGNIVIEGYDALDPDDTGDSKIDRLQQQIEHALTATESARTLGGKAQWLEIIEEQELFISGDGTRGFQLILEIKYRYRSGDTTVAV